MVNLILVAAAFWTLLITKNINVLFLFFFLFLAVACVWISC